MTRLFTLGFALLALYGFQEPTTLMSMGRERQSGLSFAMNSDSQC